MRDVITDEQIERFWSRVQPSTALDACWIWTGRTHHGRGQYGEVTFSFDGKKMHARAHRLAYELLVGPIPSGLTIDHLCRNTLCVNPDHMEPVTQSVNTGRRPRLTQHVDEGVRVCGSGHKIVGHNAMPHPGRPRCRECSYAQARARYARKRMAA